MSEKIKTKRHKLLDEMVDEIKLQVNQRMDNGFEKFIQSILLLRVDQTSDVFGEKVNSLIKEYTKLK